MNEKMDGWMNGFGVSEITISLKNIKVNTDKITKGWKNKKIPRDISQSYEYS